MSCDIGLYGLAVMGQNFALNMASHGFKVCVGNRSPAKVDLTVQRAKDEGDLPIVGTKSPEEFVKQLSKPRKIIILVMAGKPVDQTIATLSEYLEEGDVIIDGGNEWYQNTLRRAKELEAKKIHFVGMGISGGEEGARNGPSLMPGGPKEAYDLIEPIITKCAAQVNDGACTGYVGPVGAGKFVEYSFELVSITLLIICCALTTYTHVHKNKTQEITSKWCITGLNMVTCNSLVKCTTS